MTSNNKKETEKKTFPEQACEPLVFNSFQCLNNGDFLRLSKTCLGMYERAKPILTNMAQRVAGILGGDSSKSKVVNKVGYYKNVPLVYPYKLDVRILEECARAVILGEEKLAEALLEIRPESLLEVPKLEDKRFNIIGFLVDYSGREFKGLSPYQLALCTGDVGMLDMMKPFMDKLTSKDKQIMQKQAHAIFPNGDVKTKMEKLERSAKASDLIDNIFQAIIKAEDNEAEAALDLDYDKAGTLGKKLIKFKESFDKLSKSEIVFNPYHLVKAFDKYDTEYNNLGGWNANKTNLAWRQVVGYVQRYMPACLAQDFAYSIYLISQDNFDRKKLSRSFEFKDDKGYFIFPLAASSGLGVNWVCVGHLHRSGARWPYGWSGVAVTKIISNKNIRIGKFCRMRQKFKQKSRKSNCVIS